MTSTQVRVPFGLSERLIAEVHRCDGLRESVVFALASHANLGRRRLIIIQDIIVPPESAFLSSDGHGARWSGRYTAELLNRAAAENLGLLIFHAHGHSRPVSMSSDDVQSADKLLPKFRLVLPKRAHGSIVLGDRHSAGILLLPGSDQMTSDFTIRFLQNGIATWPMVSPQEQELSLFERQPLTDAAVLRKTLSGSCVAVVGLSGGGSQVAMQLAAIGIGEIIGIDSQRADRTNRLATPNLGWLDALIRLRKTTAAKVRTWAVNPRVKFTRIIARVPEPKAVEALKRADVIIGCVNNLHARADLNEIAWRYCIPYIDIGLILSTDRTQSGNPSALTSVAGNVTTLLPGGPCLWCSGFVSQEKLEHETGSRGRPYLRGDDQHGVYVTTFNGTLACEAASEALRLLSGFTQARELKRVYDGSSGTLLECVVAKQPGCSFCSGLALGDPVWG
jgi:hypothetical protein